MCICNLSFAQNTRNKPMRLDSSANSSKGQESNLLNDMILSSIKSYIEWNNNLNKGKSADVHYICTDTPVRDKVIVQTAQVVLIFRHAQEGHPACSRRSNMQ